MAGGEEGNQKKKNVLSEEKLYSIFSFVRETACKLCFFPRGSLLRGLPSAVRSANNVYAGATTRVNAARMALLFRDSVERERERDRIFCGEAFRFRE